MLLETNNLIIRSLNKNDGQVFAKIAEDGSLLDVGFTADCSNWIDKWITEAIALSEIDNPRKEYIVQFIH